MHREATLPNVLRRNWMKDNSAKDPVYQDVWGGRYFWVSVLCLFLVTWGEGRDVPWWPWRAAELIFGVICLAVWFWLSLSADRFALALGTLCQEWTFTESVLSDDEVIESVEPDQLVEWSLAEMRDRATKILQLIAGEIKRLEEKGQRMVANSVRTEQFAPTHRALYALGLVYSDWDTYFNPPHSEEQDGGQNKEESIW